MRPLLLSAAALLLPLSPAFAAEPTIVETPQAVQWVDAPPSLPKGAKLAVLFGDPGREGELFIVRGRLPAGAKIPPHTHPTAETVTVISGAFYVGMGEKFGLEAAKKVEPGGFIAMPAEHAHFGFVNDETVVEISAIGPFAINYLDPADDPSKH